MKSIPAWFQYPTFNWEQKRAVVIGGGIAGAQIAWHLCQQNWQVTIIERHDSLATEASGNPVGVISPKMTAQPSIGEDFYTQAFHYTSFLLEKLKEQGQKIDWQRCGALQLAHNPREEKRWQALKDRNLASDFIQLLDENNTTDVAGLDFRPEQPYKSSYFPKGGWIKPASFAKALVQHPNCKIICNTEITKLIKKEDQWNLIDSSGETIEQCEVVIVASGKELFSFEQSAFLPGMPVAGQTTLAPASTLSKKLKTVVGHEGYLSPAININEQEQQHIFGATFDRDVKNPVLTEASNVKNKQCLKQYLPDFAESLTQGISAHTAVRMTTPDRFPYVGALPDTNFYKKRYHDIYQGKKWKEYPQAEYQKGLFILGGLGSRGLITSGLCANALANLLCNTVEEQQLQILHNCHPARYFVKALKRKS